MSETDATDPAPAELIDHLCRSSQLTASEAEHLVNEVLNYFSQTVEEYLRSRHQELQSQGIGNSQIFVLLQRELNNKRFCAKRIGSDILVS